MCPSPERFIPAVHRSRRVLAGIRTVRPAEPAARRDAVRPPPVGVCRRRGRHVPLHRTSSPATAGVPDLNNGAGRGAPLLPAPFRAATR
jgi:hypothetical protein